MFVVLSVLVLFFGVTFMLCVLYVGIGAVE